MVAVELIGEPPGEVAVVYRDRRVVGARHDGFQQEAESTVFGSSNRVTKRWLPLVVAPDVGVYSWIGGWAPMADDPAAMAALEQVGRGDYSWVDPLPWQDRPPRSVTLFTPPEVTADALSDAIGGPLEPLLHLRDPDHIPNGVEQWFRRLDLSEEPNLGPIPRSAEAQALAEDTARWSGVASWEVTSAPYQGDLGPALRRVADVTDCALYTYANRYRSHADIVRFDLLLGRSWCVDTVGDEDDNIVGPKIPYRFRMPEPGRRWVIPEPLSEFAVVYYDGAVVRIWAHEFGIVDGRHAGRVLLDDGLWQTMGWATTPGTVATLFGTPTLADSPEATAILDAVEAGDLVSWREPTTGPDLYAEWAAT